MASLAALWLIGSNVSLVAGLVGHYRAEQALTQSRARYERWVAERQARLDSALAELNGPANSVDALADTLERRNAALAMLLTGAEGTPGLAQALAPVIPTGPAIPGGGRPRASKRCRAIRSG